MAHFQSESMDAMVEGLAGANRDFPDSKETWRIFNPKRGVFLEYPLKQVDGTVVSVKDSHLTAAGQHFKFVTDRNKDVRLVCDQTGLIVMPSDKDKSLVISDLTRDVSKLSKIQRGEDEKYTGQCRLFWKGGEGIYVDENGKVIVASAEDLSKMTDGSDWWTMVRPLPNHPY